MCHISPWSNLHLGEVARALVDRLGLGLVEDLRQPLRDRLDADPHRRLRRQARPFGASRITKKVPVPMSGSVQTEAT